MLALIGTSLGEVKVFCSSFRSCLKFYSMLAGLHIILVGALQARALLPPVNLRVQHLSSGHTPFIDTPQPLFSWSLEAGAGARGVVQETYQLQLATDAEFSALVFDSGSRASNRTSTSAVALKWRAATRYHWRVRWGEKSTLSSWAAAQLDYGLLAPADWQGARWVGCSANASAKVGSGCLARTEFTLGGRGATTGQTRDFVHNHCPVPPSR